MLLTSRQALSSALLGDTAKYPAVLLGCESFEVQPQGRAEKGRSDHVHDCMIPDATVSALPGPMGSLADMDLGWRAWSPKLTSAWPTAGLFTPTTPARMGSPAAL